MQEKTGKERRNGRERKQDGCEINTNEPAAEKAFVLNNI